MADLTGSQVVIQVEGFPLLEIDGDAGLIVGVTVDRTQRSADHQDRGHGRRIRDEGAAGDIGIVAGDTVVRFGPGKVCPFAGSEAFSWTLAPLSWAVTMQLLFTSMVIVVVLSSPSPSRRV